jgi:DNA repair protein SbcC/Rad50
MFLKEFAIRRYGPLPDSGRKELSSFNLVYGPNEEGKTLTIDALLKILFGGKGFRDLKGIRRVDETPDGYLVIGGQDQTETKLPEAGAFPELYGISASEFRNIFLIRDSDLAIAAEGEFYRGVTGRLTGMRSAEIEAIIGRLLDLGRITPGGDFQNTVPEKLKDSYKKAHLLLEGVETLLAELQAEDFNRFEEELADLEIRRAGHAELLNRYSLADSRERFEKGRHALDRLQEALAERRTLERFSQDDYETWQRIESGLDHLRDNLDRLEKEITGNRKILEKALDERKAGKLAYRKAEQDRNRVLEKVEPVLGEYDREQTWLEGREVLTGSPAFKAAAIFSALAFLISLAGSIFSPSLWLYLIAAVSLAASAYTGWRLFSYLSRKSRLAEIRTRLYAEAEKLGLPSGSVSEIRAGIGAAGNRLTLEAERLQEAEKEVEWQQKEENRLKSEDEQIVRRIRDDENSISRISRSAGVESLDQYAAGLSRKQELNSEADGQKRILGSHFERGGGTLSEEQQIRFWEEKVESLSSYAAAAPEIKYDQKAVEVLKEEQAELEGLIKDLTEKLAERNDQLRDIEKELNTLITEEGSGRLPCQTTVDLEAAEKMLRQWILEREREKESALAAIEIFREIEAEEEEKVTALFGTESPVSSNFASITGGRYPQVSFDSRENAIKVLRSDNVELEAYQLSGGTYDQLYFAIRLALGEKLLEGDKGFFILDDPFIKADPHRLRTLFEMLFDICRDGWQIIYFSSKGEVREALEQKIDSGEVREFSISGK